MILVGDWAPGRKRGELRWNAGAVLANLEGPVLSLTHRLSPVAKAGPNLFSTSLPDDEHRVVFALANNHTMDFGVRGLEATLSSVSAKGFRAVGAGKDMEDARRSIVVEDGGVCVGIISCCEAQFGVATHDRAGVAEIGPWVYGAIDCLLREADAVIVSVHAAVEVSPWPSPRVQGLYRSFVDAGASVVHGHHSHVPQGVEAYGGGVILYGLGNFLVDPDVWRKRSDSLWSLGVVVDFSSKPIDHRLLTFEIREGEDDTVCVEECAEMLDHRSEYLETCNQPLKHPALLEALWQEVAMRAYFSYVASYLGFADAFQGRQGIIRWVPVLLDGFRRIVKRTVGARLDGRPTIQDYLLRYHVFACESHRDTVATALGVLSGELKDLRTDQTRRLADEMMPWSAGVVD